MTAVQITNTKKGMNMHNSFLVAALLAVTLSACSNMTTQQRNTAIGAAAGGVAGAILTGGASVGTVGGAVVGGVIGNQIKR